MLEETEYVRREIPSYWRKETKKYRLPESSYRLIKHVNSRLDALDPKIDLLPNRRYKLTDDYWDYRYGNLYEIASGFPVLDKKFPQVDKEDSKKLSRIVDDMKKRWVGEGTVGDDTWKQFRESTWRTYDNIDLDKYLIDFYVF